MSPTFGRNELNSPAIFLDRTLSLNSSGVISRRRPLKMRPFSPTCRTNQHSSLPRSSVWEAAYSSSGCTWTLRISFASSSLMSSGKRSHRPAMRLPSSSSGCSRASRASERPPIGPSATTVSPSGCADTSQLSPMRPGGSGLPNRSCSRLPPQGFSLKTGMNFSGYQSMESTFQTVRRRTVIIAVSGVMASHFRSRARKSGPCPGCRQTRLSSAAVRP